jgi:hypothetical protein
MAREYLNSLPPYPEQFDGRGIVICAGGIRYFACAAVAAKMLRHVGCTLRRWAWPASMPTLLTGGAPDLTVFWKGGS